MGGRPTTRFLGAKRASRLLMRATSSAGKNGLDLVVVGTCAQALDLGFHVRVGRQHDDRHVRRAGFGLADLGRDLIAIHLGQADVEQHQVGRLVSPAACSASAPSLAMETS